MQNLAVVVVSYKLPPKLLQDFIENNKLSERGVSLYVVCCEDDNIYLENATLIEVPKMEMFSITKCCNAGIRKAIDDGYEIILKTDIDNYISDAVLEQVRTAKPDLGFCYRNWEIKDINSLDGAVLNDRTIGSIALHGISWMEICGYDERMKGYGWDDGDVFQRAKTNGVTITKQKTPRMYHVSHAVKHNVNSLNPINRNANRRCCRVSWRNEPCARTWGMNFIKP